MECPLRLSEDDSWLIDELNEDGMVQTRFSPSSCPFPVWVSLPYILKEGDLVYLYVRDKMRSFEAFISDEAVVNRLLPRLNGRSGFFWAEVDIGGSLTFDASVKCRGF